MLKQRMSDCNDQEAWDAQRAAGAAGITVRAVLLAVAVFYIVAAALNGRHLYAAAEKRPYGTVRALWLKGLAPARAVAVALHADVFRARLESFKQRWQ